MVMFGGLSCFLKLLCSISYFLFPHETGAEQDKLVDREGVEEMAAFAEAGPPLFLPLAHDVMLVTEWRTAAEALLDWLGQI